MQGTLILALIFIWSKLIQGTEPTESLSLVHYKLADIKYDIKKRSISDIWNSITNTANRAWEYIKDLASNTKKRLGDWIAKIRMRAQDLGKAFEERLNKLKNRFNQIIKEVLGTGEIVKKCLQDRKQEIDEIVQNIVFDVINCMSNGLNDLNNLEILHYGPVPNQTEFINVIQNDVNGCMKKYEENDEAEECILNIRKGIYKKLEATEELILKNHNESRGATDDVLNTIVRCTTEGIIKSTNIIANETIQVIECVSKG